MTVEAEAEEAKTDVTYVHDINKSSKDKCLYRGLVLPNKLQVLLISDPETDKSAASMSIAVGHLSEPDDLPGLAHFCEHMLFMGSEKYPSEREYEDFLRSHGGSPSAYTSRDRTLYRFDVGTDHLIGALDRFAQFFLNPLITKSAVESEVDEVNKEYEKDMANDSRRLYQLRKYLSKDGHPYRKFGSGNKSTLFTLPEENGINVVEELLNFHKKWYSANIMALVVLGKESLKELENMVVSLFSQVENKNVERPVWTDHPYGPNEVGKKIYTVPVEDLKQLKITFPIPDLHEHYKAKPLEYIKHLVKHEGPGSIISALKKKNWANNLIVENLDSAKGFDFFVISVNLTTDGMENADEVITVIFQYFSMLRERGVERRIFEEIQKMLEIEFEFQGKKDPLEYVSKVAENFHHSEYPLKESLKGPFSMDEWEPDLIDKLLSNNLKPSNVVVTVIDQKFQEIADEEEPRYKTKYKLEKIPDDVIRSWEDCGFNNELEIPSPNKFIPSNFDIFYDENKNKSRHAIIIHENDFTRFWLKQDDEFLLPKANLKFQFRSPLTSLHHSNFVSVHIFIDLVIDALNECKYYTKLAGLEYVIRATEYGFRLSISGYNDKQDLLLDKILEKILEFKVDQERFDISREKYITEKSIEDVELAKQADDYLLYLLQEKAWSENELVHAAMELKVEDLKKFIDQFFSTLYIECLIHGNVDEERSKTLIRIIEYKLNPLLSHPLLSQEPLRYRELKLNNGEYFVEKLANEVYTTSCVQNYYQCCPPSIQNNMLLEILEKIMTERSNEILRNKEQQNHVWCGFFQLKSIRGLSVRVGSDEHPNSIDQRIEDFLFRMRESISDMDDKEFEQNKMVLGLRRLEKPKELSQVTRKLWKEISSLQYNFYRDEIEVEHLLTIKKYDLIKFLDDYITENGPERRKLSVRVICQSVKTCSETDSIDQNVVKPAPTKIEDVSEFKSNHEFCPLAEPCVDVADFKDAELDFSTMQRNSEFLRNLIHDRLKELGYVTPVPPKLSCRPRYPRCGSRPVQPLHSKGCRRRKIRKMMHLLKRKLIPF